MHLYWRESKTNANKYKELVDLLHFNGRVYFYFSNQDITYLSDYLIVVQYGVTEL